MTLMKGINEKLKRTEIKYRHPIQYGGYDPRFVIEWARVRIPSKAWIYLREKNSDFRLKWIPVSNGKQRTPSVIG
ncbi:hypothetical protein TNCV_3093761 [Trichonephila clavipes]|nr:hypothetical protein TNCV_3093761 [Trichonephila clavipes]